MTTMEQKFVWASAHKPTQEQVNSLHGEVLFLSDMHPDVFDRMVDCPADASSLSVLAEEVLHLMNSMGATLVQPAGSPAFQMAIGIAKEEGQYYDVSVMYAHSRRESQDIPQEDGSVKKVAVFRHLGWTTM